MEDGKIYHQRLGKWHEIGETDFSRRTLTVRRNKKEHFMRAFDGYGFNKEVIESDRFFDVIILEETDEEEQNTYLLPREDVALEGKLYQAEGYERQIFLSMEQLNRLNKLK